jgi:pyruvate/2-oxoglutarate/acetoin dehydrogenase E1 component
VIESLTRTARLVVVQEASVDGSWGASLIARIVTQNWSLLDAPPTLVAGDATPIAYAAELEALWLPSVDRIVDAVEQAVAY